MAAARQRGHEQQEGVLAGHFKVGRSFLPPIMALEGTRTNDWFRDDLPDLLWPLMLVGRDGRHGALTLSKLQQEMVSELGTNGCESRSIVLDGRMSSLEAFDAGGRETLLALLEAYEDWATVIPRELVGLLRRYDTVPGSWLLVDPWRHCDEIPEFEASADALRASMAGAALDRHTNALTKSASFGWELITGRLHFVGNAADEVEVLVNYPMDEENRSAADAMILSSFLSFKNLLDPEGGERVDPWAQSFWNQNWHLVPCLVAEDADAHLEDLSDSTDDTECRVPSEATATDEAAKTASTRDPAEGLPEGTSFREYLEAAFATVDSGYESFLAEAFDQSRPVDLHTPARHEVVSGLVARAYRATIAILRAPHLWTGEHSAPTQRLLVEIIIVLSWLSANGPTAFTQYQDYGRGRRKLMRRHIEAMAATSDVDTPDYVSDLLERLEEKTGGQLAEEFLEVSVDSTFAGRSLRQMAEEVGLLDLYRSVIQSASGVHHSEWWALEDYTMTRCVEILHRMHWIPLRTPDGSPVLRFPDLVGDIFARIVDIGLEALDIDLDISGDSDQST